MKKVLFYLFVLTLASVLAACNNSPTPQVKEPDKQEETQKTEDNSKEETTKNEETEEETNKEDEEQVQVNTNTDDDELASAFQAYLDEIISLAPEEGRILEAYGNVTGDNYINDSIMYEALYYDVVPSYAEFVQTLEGIDSDNEMITDLHALYVEAATIQLGAFTVMISALEQQSTDLVEMANQGLTEASALISEWQSQVQILSVKTGVNF
ncbi:MAG TPA: hypothetical protein VNR38_12400 [Ureibacillus sp.]|nr:hypothetical protein [Ureibacillus sp.]